ncbi:MBL fold metallo-hydrolase [Pseudoxanthomonas sp. JBR18]|uniref:MBL fold metallo-hydrolase n=1 Tax=Pseudoxanthomonas sp. JBR18 TaxID=2969308 RepID=UPI002305FDFC|nr:MBL fold metallo-hydrolase [Pseudoxanthomonas sp. JBR18]WCE05264.1 MBL fold metallo-hydrolase [Pseudoxanthomonas sp. JBR18]
MSQHGIHTVDTAFQRDHFDACYLIVENGRGAFVDCGTNHSVPLLLEAIARAGLTPADIDWLLVTHIHLDHAGGAGLLLQHLPNARAVAHPRAAPHLIDPSRIVAGATAVYGEAEIARSYGQVQPVAAERVVVAADGHVVDHNGRPLLCLDTPGHARHHYCVWDARSVCWFTGDTFGLSYRELDGPQGAFILPTSSPVQFEPDALKQSIARLLAYQPQGMYLTHYGRVGETYAQVEQLAQALYEQINAMAKLGQDFESHPDRHGKLLEGLTALYQQRAREAQVPLDEAQVHEALAMDIELNAQGLACWLDRARR